MTHTLVIARDAHDALAQAGPVAWAVSHLRTVLAGKGINSREADTPAAGTAESSDGLILVAGPDSAPARTVLQAAGISLPATAEALAVARGEINGQPAVVACGSDVRGLVYAVLELADRVENAADPLASLVSASPVAEKPANSIRAVSRLFVSEVEDKPWLYDREFWARYLTMLAGQRFNRLHLAFGIGHDFLRNVIDAYLLFPYPFLVDVPGYDVRAVGLPEEERERNLAMLRYISDETARRGLQFQLGIWTQAYTWIDSPSANYTISGLTPQNHAAYCRDALKRLLDLCPAISGVTMRVHGESGVPEGSYDFWRTVFDGIVRSGRRIELDLHPKGVNRQMLEVALATGLPVNISPKYTAEHMGLPYQQASIREMERQGGHPSGDQFTGKLMSLSGGSLRYTRYGYADFLASDRRYGVFYRIWPGTQRLLLWGDPALAAGFGRFGSFCGCLGVDLVEPLSFKGRRGSGLPGGRDAYVDASLRPTYDFEKYAYTYRLFGRLLYDPDAGAEQWQRYLTHEFGAAAVAVEEALASAGRILPLVTTAHHASAANNHFWPEMYTNMPIADEALPHPYRDSDEPRRFGNVSALDPVLFSKIEEFAAETVSGQHSARYSPLRVAAWLDRCADSAEQSLARATEQAADRTQPAFRRMAIDVAVQTGLGRYFAAKLRSGVAYALYTQTGELGRLRQAVDAYRSARSAWLAIIQATQGVYRDDVTVGGEPFLRGNWADRLPAIEADLAAMESMLQQAEQAATASEKAAAGRIEPLAHLDQETPAVSCSHTPAAAFVAGQPLPVALTLATAPGGAVRLHYRHTNQAETYQIVDMAGDGGSYQAVIPGGYTDSPFALEYFFELRDHTGQAWLYPGFNATLSNQPYFVVQHQT